MSVEKGIFSKQFWITLFLRPWPDHLGRQDYSWPKIVQTTEGPRLPRSGLLMDHHTCLRTCETSDLQWL